FCQVSHIWPGVSTYDQYWNVPGLGCIFQALQHVNSRASRHVNVQDNQVRLGAHGRHPSLDCIEGGYDLQPEILQPPCQQLHMNARVIGDEDRCHKRCAADPVRFTRFVLSVSDPCPPTARIAILRGHAFTPEQSCTAVLRTRWGRCTTVHFGDIEFVPEPPSRVPPATLTARARPIVPGKWMKLKLKHLGEFQCRNRRGRTPGTRSASRLQKSLRPSLKGTG